jgi:hypothetical protein
MAATCKEAGEAGGKFRPTLENFTIEPISDSKTPSFMEAKSATYGLAERQLSILDTFVFW